MDKIDPTLSGCDGDTNPTIGGAYAGGIIRDDKGGWVAGFSEDLNSAPSWEAETQER